MNNNSKDKIIGKISIKNNQNHNIGRPSSSLKHIKNNKNKLIHGINHNFLYKRSLSSHKYKEISNHNKINIMNILLNIQNSNNKTILNNNNNSKNNIYITNIDNSKSNDGNSSSNNSIYKNYRTTSSFKNIHNQFKSLSPNISNKKNKFLLPKKNFLKKTLVLDLDETLVHSCGVPFDCPSDFIIQIEQENGTHDVHVLVRPYVEQFLEKMSKRYELVIFTASISRYANPLLNVIDKMGYVPFRLFREHCTLINTTFVKDLNLLGRDLKDIIILDNNPTAYSLNHYNGFPIKSWFNDKNDDELLKITPVLEFLSYVPDVREYIKKIVVQNQVQFDIAKQVIINYNNNLKKNLLTFEKKKFYELFKEDKTNLDKMLQKSKSSKISIIKSNNSYKYKPNNIRTKIQNYTNLNLFNISLNLNKRSRDDSHYNNSYIIENRKKISNINGRISKNRLTKRRIIKKRDSLSNYYPFFQNKKKGVSTIRSNLQNEKIIKNKNIKNYMPNYFINNINNINININHHCNNSKCQIIENQTTNLNLSNKSGSGNRTRHKQHFINSTINFKRKASVSGSETRNNKLYKHPIFKDIDEKKNGKYLNLSQKSRPKSINKNKIKLVNVGGGIKLDIKFLREQFKIYLKEFNKANQKNEKIVKHIYKNNLNYSQNIDG